MKFWLKSKTILGILISVLPTLLPMIGMGTADSMLISEQLDILIQASGALLAIYGRVKADTKIKATPGK